MIRNSCKYLNKHLLTKDEVLCRVLCMLHCQEEPKFSLHPGHFHLYYFVPCLVIFSFLRDWHIQ